MKTILKVLKRLLIGILGLLVLLAVITFIYMKQSKFGKAPSGERLEMIKRSPNYKDGKFQNLHLTPSLTEGYNIFEVTWEVLFKKSPRRRPVDSLPSIKTNLRNIPADKDVLVWFGHSSYFMQIDGKRILVDPVLSGNASPIPGTTTSFNGSDIYTVADLPDIDYLFISHDHYDHLDYETLTKLRPRVRKVICGLGVGAHFEHWGYTKDQLAERDWHQTLEPDSGFIIHTTPARHFSGRGFTRNNTLWMSYVLQTPTMKIYIGGDSGYDTHFADIGNKFGPFDLVMIDNGQYDIKWKYIHTQPAEALQAAHDLKAKRLFPVHSSKFMLANHPWDEPLAKISELNKTIGIPLVTPFIGEQVNLDDPGQQFTQWWVGLR
ncbi:MBL fold metallo-hydrolase [Chitinophaga barathri]|uniref:MBL fold metallo-hydrolase n=2 Tax=Chitinophaga barathri TaxID=1647451 RepID=A0A3N4MJW6_9BACT|nr:MBL fold metallo-hydrolase [Chitinophaga barathri]